MSTAEAEEEIDLSLVHAELMAVEGRIKEAKERHNQFLAELGLSLIP